jgi:hypothetical protein
MSELSVGSLSGLAANSYVIDVASGSSLDLRNGATLPAGSIIAVKDVFKTDTFSASVSGGGNIAVTGLSITHALSNSANKLIITAFFGQAANSKGNASVGIAVNDGTSFLKIADSAGSRTLTTASGQLAALESAAILNYSMTVTHLPGDTASKTYTVHAFNTHGDASNTIYINRDATDADNAFTARAVSGLIIQEVAI